MKTELRVINSPPPPESTDYARIYRRLIQECAEAENPSTDWKKRFVYLVIKGLPVIFDDVVRMHSIAGSVPVDVCVTIYAATSN